jgi:undecaprenyl-diphosphatase
VDAALLSIVNGAHAPWLDTVMRAASWLGYVPGIWYLSAIALLAISRLRAAAFRMALAVLVAYGIASGVMKPLVARERPYLVTSMAVRTVEAAPAGGYSFPSGHAATAVAGALGAVRMFPRAAWLIWLLAGLMAYSRIYVGVHYPSDVTAGALLGAACAWLVLGGRHPSAQPWSASAAADAVVLRP